MEEIPNGSLRRDLTAFVVVVLACPIVVWGGSMLTCIGHADGFVAACALNAFFVGPPMLALAGIVAGIASRGWTGGLIVLLATICGMLLILLLSLMVGRPVPVDWFSAVVSTIWFMAPTLGGYGLARLGTRVVRRIRRPEA